MPVTFTIDRLNEHAKFLGLPMKGDAEQEVDFRERVARVVIERYLDGVEAMEILTGKGWDVWGKADFECIVEKFPDLVRRNPAILSGCIRYGIHFPA